MKEEAKKIQKVASGKKKEIAKKIKTLKKCSSGHKWDDSSDIDPCNVPW